MVNLVIAGVRCSRDTGSVNNKLMPVPGLSGFTALHKCPYRPKTSSWYSGAIAILLIARNKKTPPKRGVKRG